MNKIDIEETTLWDAIPIAGATASSVHQHDVMQHFSVYSSIVDAAPATASLTTADMTSTGDFIRVAAHGYVTGLLGHLTGTGAALPTGLLTATGYYISKLSDDTFGLSITKALAAAGTLVALVKDNTISSFKPDALGTIDAHLQASLDGTNYWNIAGTTITAVGATATSVANIAYNYLRMDLTCSAGQLTCTVKARSLGGD